MKKRKPVRIAGALAATAVIATSLVLVGCVRKSGETWYVHSAALPEGWPTLTAVDEVEVKEYPTYRAATVSDAEEGMNGMFGELFDHISDNDIAMTAPVDMGFDPEREDQMVSMAFLYRTTELGSLGADGVVQVEDMQSQQWASVGIRGSYTKSNFRRGMNLLNEWFENQDDWVAEGQPRYLGYNSPFVPTFWRYGEVQVPVRPTDATGGR